MIPKRGRLTSRTSTDTRREHSGACWPSDPCALCLGFPPRDEEVSSSAKLVVVQQKAPWKAPWRK